jgi:hypothetical protein
MIGQVLANFKGSSQSDSAKSAPDTQATAAPKATEKKQ